MSSTKLTQTAGLRVLLLVVLSSAALLAQHGRYLNESKHPAIGDPKAIAAGAKLWATSCAGCHGPDGSGGRGPNLVRRDLWHPLSDEAIHKAIRDGVPGTDMPPTKLAEDDTWRLVAFVKSLTGPAAENKVPGDVEAGSAIFWGAAAGCSNCHSIRGKGGRMGPDLSDVGGSRQLPAIREAILEPSRDLFTFGQEGIVVTLRSGKKIEGVARNRNNYSLQVVDRAGSLHMISMLDVAQLELFSRSPMPGDYGKRLSKTDLQNLLAFLARQTVRPVETAPGEPTR
jgi:putative heme-binding domain-containing protein